MELIIGYISAVLIGITLGLIGGGGSILTVPVLVYLLRIDAVLATSYSLFIVGVTASVGAVRCMSKNLVSLKTGIVFAIPSFISVYLTRRWIIPNIPNDIAEVGSFMLTKDTLIMVLFGLLMLGAALSMIRSNHEEPNCDVADQSFNYPLIILEGIIVGIVTGLVGAGGGFLIIPALVLLSRLPMKLAVGTSLMIIAAKSLIGFTGDIGQLPIDWVFLLKFSGLAIAGIFGGIYLSTFINGRRLKQGFGWFVLLMGIWILIKELL